MNRLRTRSFVSTSVLAFVVLFGSTGGGQGRSIGGGQGRSGGRTLVQDIAPPAIDRGFSPVQALEPGSAQVVRREALRRSLTADRVSSSGTHYVPGRVIVKFRDGMSSAQRLSALSSASRTAAVTERPSYANFDIVTVDANEDCEAVAHALAARPEVEYAQAAYRVHAALVPNDPGYSKLPQWNLPMIDMERAWDIQPAAGSGITVAVLDTGVAYTDATIKFHANAFVDDQGNHYPALGDLTLAFVAATDLATTGRFVAPVDFIWNDNLPVDLNGHGTHVSGTIGQLTNNNFGVAGVAFNVKIMPVKVLDEVWDDIFGSPNLGTDDTVARGIRYAADNGAKIVNMSLGRTGDPAPVVEDAVKYAVGKGCFIAVAAGNGFEDGNPTEVLAEIASRVSGAVSVAAVDRNRNHAYYSSTGSWVELAAPGGSFRGFDATGGVVQQTLDSDVVDTFELPVSQFTAPRFDVLAYFAYTGTSQATPHVSGLAAMLMQQGITDPAAVEAALERSATDLGSPGRDQTFGFGLIEARLALRGLGVAR